MKILALILMALCTAGVAGLAQASKPTGLLWINEEEDEQGTIIEHYRVRCSNGTQTAVIKAGKGNRWCVEGQALQACDSRKNKALKSACKRTVNTRSNK